DEPETMRLLRKFKHSNFSIEDPEVNSYYRRACTDPTAAIAVVGANLHLLWANRNFHEALACVGKRADRNSLTRFLAETEIGERVLDVFASGRQKEVSLSLPNRNSRRHWRVRIAGCETQKPKRVLLVMQLCKTLMQFESDTGQVTWCDENTLHGLRSGQSSL